MRFSTTKFALASLFIVIACQDSNDVAGPDEFAPLTPAHALVAADVCDGSTIPIPECEALVIFYNSTGGGSWQKPFAGPTVVWDESNPCEWGGVICTGGYSGNVHQLMLPFLGLTGTIPPEIGDLTELEYLYLGGNELIGPLPGTIGELQNLNHIDLSSNQLSGPIPAWLGDLDLSYLNLIENDFDGSIPPELSNASIAFVLLEGNSLTGRIPSGLATSLHLFNAMDNQLSGVVPLDLATVADGLPVGCTLALNPDLLLPDLPAWRDLDTDGDGEICRLPFSPLEDVGEDVVTGIEQLVPDVLNEGVANALTTKIENAMAKAANGQYQAAINQMMAFVGQVEDMVANGVLTQEQADPFLEQAQDLIDAWTAQV